MTDNHGALHVSLIAIPDAVISTLSGIFDVLNSFGLLTDFDDSLPDRPPFTVEIVGEKRGSVALASGLSVETHRAIGDLDRTDIVIVPSVLVERDGWRPGRYPALVHWLGARHDGGAMLCSACSGIFLLAETGLFDGKATTVHWSYAANFRSAFPDVPIRPEKALVAAGERAQLVSSGASTSWHDLVLYLISRHVGPTAAQTIARFFALQWHRDGLAPYMVFEAPRGHGDAIIGEVQSWLDSHHAVASPVEEMVKLSGLPERSFKRRFTKATGYPPITYVQRLRVEDAKRRLERTGASVDEIGWQVGYEDPAFFRRLFKRVTGVSPGAYRRNFQVPRFVGSETSSETPIG